MRMSVAAVLVVAVVLTVALWPARRDRSGPPLVRGTGSATGSPTGPITAPDQPGDSYTVAIAEIDGKPALISFNMAYKGFANRASYPWHVTIVVPFANPQPNGWPTGEENRRLNDFEDLVHRELSGAGPYHYLGRVTWNGSRSHHYYVADPKVVTNALEELKKSASARPFTFALEQDVEWARVALWMR